MIKQKICIIGNGLTGLTAALILGRLNLEVHLIATPEGEKRKDVRTTAISDSNYKSLIDLIGKKYSKIFFQSKEIDLYKEYSGEIKHFMNLSKKGESLMFLFQNEILKKIIQKKINTYKNLKTYYKKVNKVDVPFTFTDKRKGDLCTVIADNSLAKKLLNWRTKRNLEAMCKDCLLYTSPSPRDVEESRMPSSA